MKRTTLLSIQLGVIEDEIGGIARRALPNGGITRSKKELEAGKTAAVDNINKEKGNRKIKLCRFIFIKIC